MQLKCQVFKEVYTPSRTGQGQNGPYKQDEKWELLLLDMTEPAEDAMADLFHYKLSEEEKNKWWGKTMRKMLTVGVHKIFNGKAAPFVTGRIIGLDGNSKG